MKPGIVAFTDCLGFKGIWTRYEPRLVLGTMKSLQEIVTQHESLGQPLLAEPVDPSGLRIRTATRFLSDTFCIACWLDGLEVWDYKEDWSLRLAPLVGIVGKIASNLLSEAAKVDPPLAMRGCISAGWFEIDSNFLIGPAIDEAAEHMAVAEGAFTWVTPSAIDCVQEHIRYWNEQDRISISPEDKEECSYELTMFLPSYDVPLKNGSSLSVPVLNPLVGEPANVQTVVVERLLSSFNNKRIDILVKKQNTKRFLDVCLGFKHRSRVSES